MSPLIDLALLLFGAKLCGILFTKIKQPGIVGELVAGIILGPSLLALVNPSSLVTSVADLGLLFIILLISLTIDWKNLEVSTEKYVWIEITRALFTIILVYVISTMFSWNIYTFLALAFTIILSSTAIVSRTLADMKQIDSAEGQNLMGIEVVDTVFGIICIAVLANLLGGETIVIEPILTTVLIVVGLFVVMGKVGFKMVNRLTSSIQKYGVEEALLGFTLLLAFLLGSLTESLRLESILGVFIAGMILSKSAQLPVIVRKVKDIGESFFIPIFFASVGLTINLMSGTGNLLFMAGLIIIIVSVKVFTSFVSLRLFNFTATQSIKISTGLITLSELTIVILALSVSNLEPGIFISLIVSYLIINAISPVIMNFFFRENFQVNLESMALYGSHRGKNKWKRYRSRIYRNDKKSYSFRGR
ncbi:MAG: cation:proton antiporter [Candidatus Aenigmarchaeota archaeon]|nr:cation:proton antiporter [Candidatus Aenigmarchaeota archaeon]